MKEFALEDWRAAGFDGFQPLMALDPGRIPNSAGVYALLRCTPSAPTFLDTSVGGHFKGKDPSVSPDILAARWIAGTDTVYIGKATSLRSRLRQLRDFGRGRPVGHWGGRYLWQLDDHQELLVCWQPTTEDPRSVERRLIAQFTERFGHRPFANLVG